MNIEPKIFNKIDDFSDLCTQLQKIDRKSQHIEMRYDDGNFPIIVEGKQKIGQVFTEMADFLERNARWSKEHKKLALRTICILKGVYSKESEVFEKFDDAIDRMERIKQKQLKRNSSTVQMKFIRKDMLACNLIFICEGNEEVTNHLSCLMQLPYFWMLSESRKEKIIEEKCFDLKQFPKNAVEIVVDLIRGRPLPDKSSFETLIWAYSLANFLLLDGIKECIGKAFKKELINNPDHLADALIFTYEKIGKFFSEPEEKGKEQEKSEPDPSPVETFYSFLQAFCTNVPVLFFLSKSKAQEIIPYFEALATQMDTFAQTFLGCCYLKGIGVEQDIEKAKGLFVKASAQKYAPAQHKLGICYEEGIGVKKDLEKAIELYIEASEQGYAPALAALGNCYQCGRSLKEAIKFYIKASEQENALAQIGLANCYEKGWEVSQDIKKAFELYTRAGEQLHPFALERLVHFYKKGVGVKQDLEKAKELQRIVTERKERFDQLDLYKF